MKNMYLLIILTIKKSFYKNIFIVGDHIKVSDMCIKNK